MDDVYNFEHFKTEHLIADAYRTIVGAEAKPGTVAPDFELPTVEGERFRLSEHLDTPVLLRFGSYT